MEQPSAVVKNNDHYLKTFISNEVFKKTPIFYSYRSFCKSVGQDAMDYPDFEFWYYRFYHGQMDFDYDRSTDPVPKTIMDMPVSLMLKITENLGVVERTHLRSMNKSLKDIVDSQAAIFDEVEINISDDCMNWTLNDRVFSCEQDKKGCKLSTPNKSEIKSDENFMKKGLEYLIPFFKIPKISVNHLSVSMFDPTSALDNLLPVPFHVRSVNFLATDKSKILPFLSAFIPGQLESIELKNLYTFNEEVMLRFLESEQFKQAKHVKLRGYFKKDDLWRFSHLESFECELDPSEQVDFPKIKVILPTFQQFEACKLTRHNNRDFLILQNFALALGEQIPDESMNIIKHRYQIPESNEYLEFEIEDKVFYCNIKIVKAR